MWSGQDLRQPQDLWMTLLLSSSYLATEHCMVNHQHDDRANDCDDHAVKVEAGNPARAESAEDEASDDRPDNTEDNIQEKPFARFVDDLAGDETGDET